MCVTENVRHRNNLVHYKDLHQRVTSCEEWCRWLRDDFSFFCPVRSFSHISGKPLCERCQASASLFASSCHGASRSVDGDVTKWLIAFSRHPRSSFSLALPFSLWRGCARGEKSLFLSCVYTRDHSKEGRGGVDHIRPIVKLHRTCITVFCSFTLLPIRPYTKLDIVYSIPCSIEAWKDFSSKTGPSAG